MRRPHSHGGKGELWPNRHPAGRGAKTKTGTHTTATSTTVGEISGLATLAAGRPVLPATGGLDITVNEVLLAFVTWSQGHYRHPDGTPTTEVTEIIRCLKPVRQLFGTTLAYEFGPRKLATVRQHMIGLGWCRGAINQHVGRIKRAFRHAVAEEILPTSVFESLRSLRRTRTEAHDNAPVMPVELVS